MLNPECHAALKKLVDDPTKLHFITALRHMTNMDYETAKEYAEKAFNNVNIEAFNNVNIEAVNSHIDYVVSSKSKEDCFKFLYSIILKYFNVRIKNYSPQQLGQYILCYIIQNVNGRFVLMGKIIP